MTNEPQYPNPDAWKHGQVPPVHRRASTRTFETPLGRRVGVWVRGGTEAELAEFVSESNFFRPIKRGI